MKDVQIGQNCILGQNVHVASGVVIGNNVKVQNNVSIYTGVVGSKKMVTFDDMEPTEKIRMYDKTAEINHEANTFAEFISLRFGNILIPEVKSEEPLAKECAHFIDCILDDKPVLSDGNDGLRVVQILEAGQKSLKNNSIPVNLGDFECRNRRKRDILSTNRHTSIKTVKSAEGQKSGIFHT